MLTAFYGDMFDLSLHGSERILYYTADGIENRLALDYLSVYIRE